MPSFPAFLRYGTLLTQSAWVRLLVSAALMLLLAALTYWAIA